MHAMGRNRLGPGAFSMFENAPSINVVTANGTVNADTVLPTHVGMLGAAVRFYIMDQADPLLSIGQLVEQGFGFAWPPSGPTLTTPDGDVIHLKVDSNNPILDGGCRVEKSGRRKKVMAGRSRQQHAEPDTSSTGSRSSGDPAPLQCGVCGEDSGAMHRLVVGGATGDPSGSAPAEPQTDGEVPGRAVDRSPAGARG